MASNLDESRTTAQKQLNVILTGGTGYLGQHFLASLLSPTSPSADDDTTTGGLQATSTQQKIQQYDIRHIYLIHSGRIEENLVSQAALADKYGSNADLVSVHKLDLSDPLAIDSWIQAHVTPQSSSNTTSFICFHLAAISSPRVCQENSAKAHAINNPKHWFETLWKNGCRRIVALSTDQIYDGRTPPYEALPPNKLLQSPVNVYGTTKRDMEVGLLQLQASNDESTVALASQIVLLRCSIILGPKAPIWPDQTHATFLHFCSTRQGLETKFFTDERRNVISVTDVVRVLHRCMAQGDSKTATYALQSGIYNLGGPESASRYDMARAVFDHMSFDPSCLEAVVKGQEAALSATIPAPLDISMVTTALPQLLGLQFMDLRAITKLTFPSQGN